MEEDRVSATPDALEVIERLAAEHGPLVFLQSGGCCDGSSPLCLRRGELPIGPNDVLLGEVGPASFYVDRDQFERWGRPRFVIGVSPGMVLPLTSRVGQGESAVRSQRPCQSTDIFATDIFVATFTDILATPRQTAGPLERLWPSLPFGTCDCWAHVGGGTWATPGFGVFVGRQSALCRR